MPNQGVKSTLQKDKKPYQFQINPSTLEKIKISNSKIPNFDVQCMIENTNCDIYDSFNGIITVKETGIPIKSIELQFIRNETIQLPNGDPFNENSEIQNLQVGDGEVNKNVEIPLFMIFPRFFSCASLDTKLVKLSFEVNIILVLSNGFVITENFPINTWRS